VSVSQCVSVSVCVCVFVLWFERGFCLNPVALVCVV